jgi:hypothetical protein
LSLCVRFADSHGWMQRGDDSGVARDADLPASGPEKEAPRDAFVDFGSERVAPKYRARQPEAPAVAVVVGLDRGGRRLVHPSSGASEDSLHAQTIALAVGRKRARQWLLRGSWLGRATGAEVETTPSRWKQQRQAFRAEPHLATELDEDRQPRDGASAAGRRSDQTRATCGLESSERGGRGRCR